MSESSDTGGSRGTSQAERISDSDSNRDRASSSSSSASASKPTRAKRGKARVNEILETTANRTEAVLSSPGQSLDTLAEELENEIEAVAVLRSSCLVFHDASGTVDELDPRAASNEVFRSHVATSDLLHAVLGEQKVELPEDEQRRQSLLSRAERLREDLAQIKSRAWQQHIARVSNARSQDGPVHDNVSTITGVGPSRTGINLGYLFIVLVAHFIIHATFGMSNALLSGLDVLVRITVAGGALANHFIPHDLRTAISWFPLEADFQSIACCPNPECCKLHYPDENNRLPERCDASFASWKCGWVVSTKYSIRGKEHSRPVRSFHHQSVTSWVGNLLARPGMEQSMEEYVSGALAIESPSSFGDIWHTPFLRAFQWGRGPHGFGQANGDLRLLFSLAIDWFTAHRSKQAGKKWSIGAIYLVCQNLPLDIRFRDENICLVGIIPGRTKPLGHAINWFLQRLVDEFVAFYETGVWYTQTFKYPHGRRVWAAIGPVVCDLDAARGVTGLGSVSHTLFCSLCKATKAVLATGEVDTVFEPRCGSAKEGFKPWFSFMKNWIDATSIEERTKLWKDHAIRWTELARLPYWNPFQFSVIDPMHNLLLGLFRWHMRVIWRMDVDVCGWGDEVQLDEGQIAHAKMVFAKPNCTAKDLKTLSYPTLQGLASRCRDITDEVIAGRKDGIIKALIDWRATTAIPAMSPDLHVTDSDNDLANEWLLTQPKLWHALDHQQLSALCQKGGIAISSRASKKKMVEELGARLAGQEDEVADEEDHTPSVMPAKGKRNARSVALGRGVVSAISKDIVRTVLPDWIDRAPKHIGNTKHGKLSANHWRVLCTVHCVITLVRLWGLLPLKAFRYQALENFIYLVKASELAMKRVTTRERRQEYTTLIKLYLKGLKQLYPRRSFAPNHHLATHLAEFLRRFGPPHSWWAFPFERYNGILQKIQTNDIIGQMEKTIMQKFNQTCRLKWMIFDNAVPDTVKPLIPWALEQINKAYSGTLLVENDAAALAGHWSVTPGQARPSKRFHELLNMPGTALQTAKSIHHRGMTFCASQPRTPPGNSIVLIKVNGDTAPARIREIAYVLDNDNKNTNIQQAYILVDVYSELAPLDISMDPYRRWRRLQDLSGLDCHLRYMQFDKKPRLVHLSALVGHAAMCEYEAAIPAHQLKKKAAVFVSLDRLLDNAMLDRPSNTVSQGTPLQTRAHLLTQCPELERFRGTLRNVSPQLDVAHLLGTREGIAAVAKFIRQSGAFGRPAALEVRNEE